MLHKSERESGKERNWIIGKEIMGIITENENKDQRTTKEEEKFTINFHATGADQSEARRPTRKGPLRDPNFDDGWNLVAARGRLIYWNIIQTHK